MTGPHVNGELYELLQGELSSREMVRVNDHLKGCELCRQELIDVSLAHVLLTSVSDILAPEFAAARPRRAGESDESDLPPLAVMSSLWAEREMRSSTGAASSAPRSLAAFERGGHRPRTVRTPSASAAIPLAAGGPGGASADVVRATSPGDVDAGSAPGGPHRNRRRRAMPASSSRHSEAQHPGRHRSRLVAVMVAVLVFATLLGVGSWQHARTSSQDHILLTAALLPLPAAPSASGSVTVRADGDVTVTTSLRPAGSGHYYEVWLIDPGRPKELPLGILPDSGTGRFSFPVSLWGGGFAGVAISLQVTGLGSSNGVQMLSTAAPVHRVAAHVSSSRPRSRGTSGSAHRRTHGRSNGSPRARKQHHGSAGSRPARALLASSQAPPALRKLLSDSEPMPTAGPVLRVDTTHDSNAIDPLSGICRDSFGRCSLRAALEVANARRSAVVIRLPAGTYVLTLGPLVASDPAGVSIEGESAALTVLTAGGKSRVLLVEATSPRRGSKGGAEVALARLTLRDGVSAPSGPLAGDGGAVLVSGGADVLELSQVSIVDSHAAYAGGGVYSRGQLWATAATFRGDSAGSAGGAVALALSEAVVTNSLFADDSAGSPGATGAAGGAVEDGAAALVLVYSKLTHDSVVGVAGALRGGALDLHGPAWVASDVFNGNHVQAVAAAPAATAPKTAPAGNAVVSGGAVYVAAGASSIEDSTFENNEVVGAVAAGGAIFNAADLDIAVSRFVGNEAVAPHPPASTGGGGAVYDAGKLAMAGDWFSLDSTDGDGGGLYEAGMSRVVDSVFVWNRSADDGGAIYDGGALVLIRSTLSHGLATRGGGLFVEGALRARGDAIVDNRAVGSGAAGGGLYLAGGTMSAVAPGMTLTRSTIAGNVAPIGAGVAAQSVAGPASSAAPEGAAVGLVSRSDIADNTMPSGAEQDCAAIGNDADAGSLLSSGRLLSSGGGNVVGDTSCGLTAGTDREGPAAEGYWLVSSQGIVRSCDVPSYETVGSKALGSPVVAMAATPGDDGYWEVTADGGVRSFGAARSFGSALGRLGHSTIAGFATTLDGGGYWLVTSDGVVFNFGDAGFYGSAPGEHVVAITRSIDGRGYWLLEANGGVLAFGDALRLGDHAGIAARAIAATPDGEGYWVAASDGQVFAFGDARSYGHTVTTGVLALLPSADGRGYLVVTDRGQVFAFGDAPRQPVRPVLPVVAAAA